MPFLSLAAFKPEPLSMLPSTPAASPRNAPHIAWPRSTAPAASAPAGASPTAATRASALAQPAMPSPAGANANAGAPAFARNVFAPAASAPATPAQPSRAALPAFLRNAAGLLLIAALLLFVIRPAHAGQACNDVQLNAEQIRASLNLALKSREALEASGAQVAMIARAGQDLSRHGLRYSHLGWAWRDHPKGRWFVVHELNACGTASSELYDEGLGNFFLTDLYSYEALIVIPPPEAQARIAQRLAREPALALHQPRYNMVAHPFNTKYQNSNQWGMETLAAALAPEGSVADRAAAQAWLRQNGFTPTTLQLSTLTRLGGRMFRANVAFDDHPDERRYAGRIETTTVESAAAFLQARGAKSQVIGSAQ